MPNDLIIHLLRVSDLRASDGPIAIESVEADGFVRCASDEATMLEVANTSHRSEVEPMAALILDPAKIGVPVRFEQTNSPGTNTGNRPIPYVHGPIDRAAITEIRYARRDVNGTYIGFDRRSPLVESLDLLPHPEGGWFRETWRSGHTFTPAGYAGARAAGTAIYYVLGAGDRSVWHRVRSDELWLWHTGLPLALTLGGDGPQPDRLEHHILGGDVPAGHRPQVLVPAGWWQSAEPLPGEADEVLVSCVVSPGFDFADFDSPAGLGER